MKLPNLKKIDLSGIKEYLFQKGERVGMIVCGGIAVLLLAIGLLKAGGSNTSYANDLDKASKEKEARIVDSSGAETTPVAIPEIPEDLRWPMVYKKFDQAPYWLNGEATDTKRRNPAISSILVDEKHLAVDFLRCGYFSYDLDLPREKALAFEGGEKGAPRLVKIMKYARMVLVSAVFPMREQLEEFRSKLRFATLDELRASPDNLPQALGLNVYRCEVKADGKYTDWAPVYRHDPKKDKIEVAERIDKLFREAFIDQENPKTLTYHLQHGMATPLPELANIHYPKLDKLEGIKLVEGEPLSDAKPKEIQKGSGTKKGPIVMPGKKETKEDAGNNDPDASFKLEAWKKFPDLHAKFAGKIDFFDPFGGNPQEKGEEKKGGFTGPKGLGMKDKGAVDLKGKGQGEDTGEKTEEFDSLVRFIDIDVEPGKTYVYTFKVIMANPNYKKKNEVAFQALAEIKELESPFANTPPITIPGEFFFYAVDQFPDQNIVGGSDTTPAKSDASVAYGKWTAPVQIHRWIQKFTGDFDATVADWAIAERLLVRRGDIVGRNGVNVEVPVWNKSKEAFEIGFLAQKADKKKGKHAGVPVDFVRDNPPPLLVDFEGGWKKQVTSGAAVLDESALDMLILTPEGKLIVRNSRRDTDLDNPVARERDDRWKEWRERLLQLRGGGAGGITMPTRPKN